MNCSIVLQSFQLYAREFYIYIYILFNILVVYFKHYSSLKGTLRSIKTRRRVEIRTESRGEHLISVGSY
jgi:hypothetical protein